MFVSVGHLLNWLCFNLAGLWQEEQMAQIGLLQVFSGGLSYWLYSTRKIVERNARMWFAKGVSPFQTPCSEQPINISLENERAQERECEKENKREKRRGKCFWHQQQMKGGRNIGSIFRRRLYAPKPSFTRWDRNRNSPRKSQSPD